MKSKKKFYISAIMPNLQGWPVEDINGDILKQQ